MLAGRFSAATRCRMRLILAALASAALAGLSASAHDYAAGDLHIEHPWASPPLAGQNRGAAYLVIENHGDAPDRLLAASSEVATAELHASVMDGDVARMAARDTVEIPAHGTATFEPGGLHIMLMNIDRPLAPDDSFPMTLTFERAGDVEVDVHVEALAQHMGSARTMHDEH